MRTTSLSRQVSFGQVLPLLGVRVRTNALPTATDCPLCRSRGQLHVYRDRSFGGEWAFCRQCHFSGNMIRLAAAVWKLDTMGTLHRLVSSGIGVPEAVLAPTIIKDYIQDHVKYDHRVEAFWKECQNDHLRQVDPGIRQLHREFNCAPSPDWADRGGLFIGSSDHKKVNNFFFPNIANKVNYKAFYGHGAGWRGVLIFPYSDLPGRTRGLVIIGRSGDLQSGDWFYLPLEHCAGDDHNSGLGMLDALLYGPHPNFGNTGFIFTDPHAAMQLQLRHMKEHRRPLPLACTWRDDRMATDRLDWLSHDDLIFWGCEDRIEPIIHAKNRNAQVATLHVTQLMLTKNLRNRSSRDWLDRLKKSAAPWQVALEMELESLSSDQIEGTFCRLGLHGQALHNFISGCTDTMKKRLEHIQKYSVYAKSVTVGGCNVNEHDGCWWLEKPKSKIKLTNAIVRIDYCLTTRGDNTRRSYYRGVVKFNGAEYPFTERVEAIDAGLFNWTLTFLRDRMGVGVPEFYALWNSRSFQLAIAFQEPKMVTGVDSIGWDKENLQFNFPNFSICRDGSVTDEFSCLFNDQNMPGKGLAPPGAIPMKHMELLNDNNEETRIFWGVAAHISATLMCPAINRTPVGLLLDGAGAQAVGVMAAQRLGSILHRTKRGDNPIEFVRRFLSRHKYPYVIDNIRPGEWLNAPDLQHTILTLSAATNRVLAGRGTWNIIHCARKLGSMQLLAPAVSNVLPNYLQDVFSRGLLIGDTNPDLILNVLDDMTEWFQRIGGKPDVVAAASQHMQLPGNTPAWLHFVRLAFQLYDEGRLTFTRAGFDSADTNKNALVEVDYKGKTMMWVSQDRFAEAVTAAGSLPPDLLLITKSLEDEGVLLSEPVYRDDRGWLLPNVWWNENLETWRST